MNQNKQGLITHLSKFGKTNDYSWDALATKFGYTKGEAARKVWSKHKLKNFINTNKHNLDKAIEDFLDYESKINIEKGTGTVKWISTKEVLTEKEIYKECKMNPDKWIMTNIWHKKRSTGFVYSADFKLKWTSHVDTIKDDIDKILNNYKTKYIPLRKQDILVNDKFADPCSVFISITDAHLDRLTTHGRTIDNSVKEYLDTVEYLILKSFCCNLVDEVVYVIGNDLFDSDTYYSETTNGTQQHSNSMYYDSYEKIFDMEVKAINKLKQFCNTLHIKFIPGNHDRTKGFYLVHALEVYFKGDKNIVFDRGAENTKVYTYGNNFIGMHHGDTKPEDLPLYFASKYSKEWGKTKYKEIGLGDKHVKKSWQLRIKPTEDELNGVRIFMTPSLCDNSLWEKNCLYDNSISAGICRIYSKEDGKVGEFEKRINFRK